MQGSIAHCAPTHPTLYTLRFLANCYLCAMLKTSFNNCCPTQCCPRDKRDCLTKTRNPETEEAADQGTT